MLNAIWTFSLLKSTFPIFTVKIWRIKQQQQPFNGPLSGTTRLSQSQKGKTLCIPIVASEQRLPIVGEWSSSSSYLFSENNTTQSLTKWTQSEGCQRSKWLTDWLPVQLINTWKNNMIGETKSKGTTRNDRRQPVSYVKPIRCHHPQCISMFYKVIKYIKWWRYQVGGRQNWSVSISSSLLIALSDWC